MNISNIIKISYRALMRNKMRAFLTMLGIIIGISSVIAMVSLGQSSTYNITKEISTAGSNMISIGPQYKRTGGVWSSSGDVLKMEDLQAIKKQSSYVNAISPYISTSGQLICSNRNYPSSLKGVNADYFKINNLELESGTLFHDQEVTTSAKVCIIGSTIVRELFPDGSSPLGRSVRFNNIPLLVIGVIKEKGESGMGQNTDELVFIPYTTIQNRILAIDHLQGIYASVKNEKDTKLAVEEISGILRRQHKLTSIQEDDFQIHTQADMLKMVSKVTDMLTMLLAAIGSISLLVGGIGIMNIMYVTVTERTKEIGLRMAIGAQNRNILFQFLGESVILCFIGGVIGILLGLLMAYVITTALNWPFIVSFPSIIISFLVCGTVGIFFGWYPAKKASQLDPITALRYE